MNPHKPPKNPPRKNLCVGRKDGGNRDWKRQMENQDVPMLPARKVEILKMDLAREFREVRGRL